MSTKLFLLLCLNLYQNEKHLEINLIRKVPIIACNIHGILKIAKWK